MILQMISGGLLIQVVFKTIEWWRYGRYCKEPFMTAKTKGILAAAVVIWYVGYSNARDKQDQYDGALHAMKQTIQEANPDWTIDKVEDEARVNLEHDGVYDPSNDTSDPNW